MQTEKFQHVETIIHFMKCNESFFFAQQKKRYVNNCTCCMQIQKSQIFMNNCDGFSKNVAKIDLHSSISNKRQRTENI